MGNETATGLISRGCCVVMGFALVERERLGVFHRVRLAGVSEL